MLPCKESCGYRQSVFEGSNVPANFYLHVMTRHYRDTALIAHNAKGFDNYPILNALIHRHGVRPNKIMYNGSKIMYIHLAHGLVLTNFIGMKSKIPECFDLAELQKGYFPHLFNTTQNQDYVGIYPDPKYYGVEYMSAKERLKFLKKWHDSKKDQIFDFRKELQDYCVSDVDILRRGCIKFREIMMEVTSRGETLGIDPIDHFTIASACQTIYRELFLEEKYETNVTDNTTRRYRNDQRNSRKVVSN